MRISSLFIVVLVTLVSTSAAHTHAHVVSTVDDNTPRYIPPSRELTGGFTIVTVDSLRPTLVRLAEAFMQVHPHVMIKIATYSTANLARFAEPPRGRRAPGATEEVGLLGSLGLLNSTDLEALYSRTGYPPTAISIGFEALAVYVRADAPLHRITLDQLDAIFSKDRKRGYPRHIEQWTDLGAGTEGGAREIHPAGPPSGSPARAFFQHHVMRSGGFHAAVKESSDEASLHADLTGGSTTVAYDVLSDPAPGLRALDVAVRAEGPFVSPTVETACKGTYPLSTFAYLYVNKSPWGTVRDDVQAFLLFANSLEGQQALNRGLFPLPLSRIQMNQTVIESLVDR